VLRLAWYTADSIRRFDLKTNRTADSIESDGRFDSRFNSNEKNDSQVPTTTAPEPATLATCL